MLCQSCVHNHYFKFKCSINITGGVGGIVKVPFLFLVLLKMSMKVTHSHTYLFISHGRYLGHSVTNEVKAQP